MNDLDQIMEEKFPLRDYMADRKRLGHVSLAETAETEQIAPGFSYRKCRYVLGDGRHTWVYFAFIDPDAPVQLAVSAAPLRTIKTVKNHCIDYETAFDTPVFFGMNAGFFHFFRSGDLTPYGIQVVNGVEMALPALQDKDSPWYSHNMLAVDKQGNAFVTDSQAYYKSWQGRLDFAVGGGFRLIRDGKICLHMDQQGGEFNYAPRTAVAIAGDGTVILLCADGRSKASAGLSYGDMIEIILGLGLEITQLFNLDGGGSTTMVIRDLDGQHRVRNVPSGPAFPLNYQRYGMTRPEPCGDTQVRGVADAILVIPKKKGERP